MDDSADDDSDCSAAEYDAKLQRAFLDGVQAGYRGQTDEQMPYYEDLNCDRRWALGYIQGAEQAKIREAGGQ